MNQLAKIVSTYECVAQEYYDSMRHPTCANFAELSGRFLVPRIWAHAGTAAHILEIGAGRSIVAPVLFARGLSLSNLILLDESAGMLQHSRQWSDNGAVLHVADAGNTNLPSGSFQLIVSSLGDPYNTPQFWHEIGRLLSRNGLCIFTIPTPEWADRFRAGSDPRVAEFELRNGARILVPSIIPQTDEQIKMIASAGLRVNEICDLNVSCLSTPPSIKLLISPATTHFPVVRGFTINAS